MSYNLFRHNCYFFSQALAQELGVGNIPEWVYCLAQKTEGLEPTLIKLNQHWIQHHRQPKKTTTEMQVGVTTQQQKQPAAVVCSTNQTTTTTRPPGSTIAVAREDVTSSPPPPVEAHEIMLDHTMAVRIQRSFRKSKKRNESGMTKKKYSNH